MGNSIACVCHQGKRSKTYSHETTEAIEHNSLKNLQMLKKKHKSRSHYKARNRSSNYRILPTSVADERETDQREGYVRVKMVLTKKEVAELLSMLRTSRIHGGNREQSLSEEIEESDRVGWTPSLQSIPESEDY